MPASSEEDNPDAPAEPKEEAAEETQPESTEVNGRDPFAFVAPGTGDIEIPDFAEAPEEETSADDPQTSGTVGADVSDDIAGTDDPDTDDEKIAAGDTQRKILHFVDVFQNQYEVEIDPKIEASPYDNSCFFSEGNKVVYEDDHYTSRQGVDVSYHQGDIDWEQVKEAGYDFAFIRIGYRGDGKTGSVNLDKEFYNHWLCKFFS